MGIFDEQIKAKDKWINELLEENSELKDSVERLNSLVGYLEEHIEFCKMCHNPIDDCLCG